MAKVKKALFFTESLQDSHLFDYPFCSTFDIIFDVFLKDVKRSCLLFTKRQNISSRILFITSVRLCCNCLLFYINVYAN